MLLFSLAPQLRSFFILRNLHAPKDILLHTIVSKAHLSEEVLPCTVVVSAIIIAFTITGQGS